MKGKSIFIFLMLLAFDISIAMAASFEVDTQGTLTNGLISYWKLDESSGTRTDSKGTNSLAGNGVGSAAGIKGNAGQFSSSSSSYLSIADNPDLSVENSDFTISAWVNLNSKTTYRTIAGKDNYGSREYMLHYINSPSEFDQPKNDKFGFWIDGGNAHLFANSAGSPSTGTGYFVVAWFDSKAKTLNIQINNGPVDSISTGSIVPHDGTSKFGIGGRELSGAPLTFDGKIDEVGFWKKVLTTQEKSDLYNNGNGNTIIADLCTGVTCNIPDQPKCDGSTLITYYLPGACSATGKCTYTYSKTECLYGCSNGKCLEASKASCTDSDGGRNYNVKGSTKLTDGSGLDDDCRRNYVNGVLTNTGELLEAVCLDDGSDDKYITYNCPNGCSNGVCICPLNQCPAPPENCYYAPQNDSNGCPICGKLVCEYSCDKLLESQASYFDLCKAQGYDKVCFNKNTQVYQGCGKSNYNDCTINNVNAAQNVWCNALTETKCVDSDGGRNYNIAGSVSSTAPGYVPVKDYCAGNNVIEYYCNADGTPGSEWYNCPNGCSDGACLKEPQAKIAELKTDRKFYGIGNEVTIIAKTSGITPSLSVDITNPKGEKETMQMSGVCTKSVPEECTLSAKYGSTFIEGYYNVELVYDSSKYALGEYSSVNFPVLDLDKASKYVILSDIGNHKLDLVSYTPLYEVYQNYPFETYTIVYADSDIRTDVAAYIFSDRQSLERFVSRELSNFDEYIEKEYIDGNLVYILTNVLRYVLWTNNNVLIVLNSGNGYPVTSEKNQVISKKDVVYPDDIQLRYNAHNVPKDILSAYLNKHPSDLDKISIKKEFKLWLTRGWNLFSTPVYEKTSLTEFKDFETNCRYTGSVWGFDNLIKKYSKIIYITDRFAAGYWVRVKDDCFVIVKGDDYYKIDDYFGEERGIKLNKGWNIIGGVADQIEFSEIRGDCVFNSGPYRYNSFSKEYEKAVITDPGKGYIINVNEDCTLKKVEGEEEPPQLPFDLEITAKVVWKK
ncbi:MAG: LamG domain-containing protein [Candidatus Aenigmarchaeota archaeon]|nr:LamG domain-containing protein [Candidatus Aenigmarchaeota archaeon]